MSRYAAPSPTADGRGGAGAAAVRMVEVSVARKTKENAEKTKQSILQAAFAVFTEKGFMRATLSEIAAAAGVTRGAVYWHFKDKVDLFIALSEEIETTAAVRPEDIRTESLHSLEDLEQELARFFRLFESNDRYAVFYELVNYRTEYTDELEAVWHRRRDIQRRFLGKAEELFARLKTQGLVRANLDPTHAATALLAFVAGLIQIWLSDRFAFCFAEAAPLLLADFLCGMRPQSGC